jgi:hypothetical protein
MHDVIVGISFLAMIAAPCVVTLFRKDEETA